MATYNFEPAVVYGQVGSLVRLGVRSGATFPVTKLDGTSATVVQGGVTKAGYVESNASGLIPAFTTTDIPSVRINFGMANLAVHSLEAISAGAASAASASTSATSALTYKNAAETAATNAATSASTAADAANAKRTLGDAVASTATDWRPEGAEYVLGPTTGYNAYPWAVRTKAGTILVTYRASTLHGYDATATVNALRSTDDGRTFGSSILMYNPTGTGEGAGTAGLASLWNGDVAALYLRNSDATTSSARTLFAKSTDDGLTWAAPTEIVAASHGFTSWCYPTDLIEMPNRDLLAVGYGQNAASPNQYVATFASSDGGTTWARRSVVAPDSSGRDWQEPRLVLMPNGELLCFLRSDKATPSLDDAHYLSRSLDGGYTWTTPVRLFIGTGMPCATVTQDGALLMQYRYQQVPNRWARSAASFDGGYTWEQRGDFMVGGQMDWMYGAWVPTADGEQVAFYGKKTPGNDYQITRQFYRRVRRGNRYTRADYSGANFTLTVAGAQTLAQPGDIAVKAKVGDVLMVGLSAMVGAEANTTAFDVATVVSSTLTNYLSSGNGTPAAAGVAAWYAVSGVLKTQSGEVPYVVQAGDIATDGTVTLRLRVSPANTTARTVYGAPRLSFWVRNVGKADIS